VGHLHKKVRDITYSWIERDPKGPRKEEILERFENQICTRPRNRRGITRKTVVLRGLEDSPTTFFFNSDIYNTGQQEYTGRAGSMEEVIRDHCTATGGRFYRLPFSVIRSAHFPLPHLDVIDSFEIPDSYRCSLLLKHGDKKLLIDHTNGPVNGVMVSGECNIVLDALEYLKPEVIKEDESNERKVIKYGEWFLSERPELAKVLKDKWEQKKLYADSDMRGYRLMHKGRISVAEGYVATRGCSYEGNVYVNGTIRHHSTKRLVWTNERSTGKHPMIKLELPWLAVHDNSSKHFFPRGF
jgi:hypothetical protein